jgi:hypothetical protein
VLVQEPGAIEQWAGELEGRSVRPMRIAWTKKLQGDSAASSPGHESVSGQTEGPDGTESMCDMYECNVVMDDPEVGVQLSCDVCQTLACEPHVNLVSS